MTDVNPFEVSESCKGAALPFRVAVDPHWFRVDGNLLVCGQSVILPRICYKTGVESDLVQDAVAVQYPSLKIVLTLRYCGVKYFMSRSVSRKRLFRSICDILMIIGGVLMFLGGEWILPMNFGTGAIIGNLMIVGGLVDRMFLKPNLKLIRYEVPGYYFVRGFSRHFLARLAEIAEKSERTHFPGI